MATVVLTPDAVRNLAELQKPTIARMDKLIERLREWPDVSGAKPLRGELAGRYRLRSGDYRLQFYVLHQHRLIRVERTVKKKKIVEENEVVDIEVIVEKVGHRDGFYDE
jgi:mRNA-degrading endonuclease RelE of RelBE toxin-antitoxin system